MLPRAENHRPHRGDERVSRPLREVIAEAESDPERRRGLQEARRKFAEELERRGFQGLSLLRLRKGMSQRDLAERVGTSQSHIAEIEAGRGRPRTDTVARIAEALGVDEGEVVRAIEERRRERGGEGA